MKDAIEQAIRDDKLNEFIQIIREPRTFDREKSPRPECRNPRSCRDDDEQVREIAVITDFDSPMVISAKLGPGLVHKILVDTGPDSNIMFKNVFDALGFKNNNLKTHQPGVMGIGDHFIKPDRSIDLPMTHRIRQDQESRYGRLSQEKSELSLVTGKQLRNAAMETSLYGSNLEKLSGSF
ncbi:hypothetical protein PIB30_047803 [Stylosanthes scabra]|uniref:Peptidase A2 domain-containing protein n=1 Tax=Stylosanthes scabra TaxID=79078 RepID=A0ABU6WHX5_9FABA|nr:hypothetical protein [Stylosanthes scabra]